MKKTLLFIIPSIFYFHFLYAQKSNDTTAATPEEQEEIIKSFDTTKILAETGDSVCKCIDKISLTNKDSKEISAEIKECIDKDVTSYAIEMKLFGSLKTPTKNTTINIDEDPNSTENKKYYYIIERWLRDNCSSLNTAVGSINKESDKSLSNNLKAIDEYNAGITLFNQDNYSDALPHFKKAVEIDPQFVFAWDNLGKCYRQTGDLDNALEAYNKSLEIDPKGEMPLQNIAIVYIYKKQYDKAISSYQNLLSLYPNDPETYYGIGRVYTYYKNDMEKGLDNMCKAYNLYVQLNSAYRVDAEKNIQFIYQQMKKDNKENTFNKILKDNNISPDK